MITLKEAVIVEGRYDKIKLSELIDSPIIETNGFRIFNDREKINLIRNIAKTRGILILTDSDSAGLVIRNFLKGAVNSTQIKHGYIPEILGKEKRKDVPSKEGLLGVEGVSREILLKAIQNSGATIFGESSEKHINEISKADLFSLGLTGCDGSLKRRETLLKKLNFPTYLSTNAMLTALNCLLTLNELKNILSAMDFVDKQ
ncbi:MAG: DUF4093 domain-containing protein [Bacillota bacterium]|nr:DUF4093 domain-containing protein [Bacillota bacterium]